MSFSLDGEVSSGLKYGYDDDDDDVDDDTTTTITTTAAAAAAAAKALPVHAPWLQAPKPVQRRVIQTKA